MVGYGYGKVILFGEHFVVYGLPGIAGGIKNKTTATAKKSDKPGLFVIDNRPAAEGYKEKKAKQFNESMEYIKSAMPQIDWMSVGADVVLGGDLIAASGVGASAASCAAIARSLDELFELGLSDDEINDIAYEGEKGYHGNPSGLDNSCATYGTLITFKRMPHGNQMKRLNLPHKVRLVMANTGIPVDTKAIVEGVKKRKEDSPHMFEDIFDQYESLVDEAIPALKKEDWKEIGHLMDQNQRLLSAIGVSHEKLNELIMVAKDAGAYGAKLTGGGAGGYMVALTPTEEIQKNVAEALRQKVDIVIETSVGGI